MKEAKIDLKSLHIWVKMLPRIEDETALYILSRKLNMTYAYAHLITKEMEKKGWITKTLKGRSNIYKLTEKGLEMASVCNCMIGGLI